MKTDPLMMHSSDCPASKMFIIHHLLKMSGYEGLACETAAVVFGPPFQLNPLEVVIRVFPMGISQIRHVCGYVLLKS